uniref:Transmembrane protein 74 n=1 Tax=Gouania willdenowi TaxID=441366 RepID=A0A8C5EC07_GOUWI
IFYAVNLVKVTLENSHTRGGKLLLLRSGDGGGSAPWTEESETSFTCEEDAEDEDEQRTGCLVSPSPAEGGGVTEEEDEEDISELYLLSDDDLSMDDSGKSVDYGFIVAVSCLVTGISLVGISYAIPRDVRVDPDTVSAREMEHLEMEKARVGAHLDRCVIAGLCLLTLGGVLLSTLLMVSLWKGEMMRRKAYAFSKQETKLYGSISLRTGTSPTPDTCSHLSQMDEVFEVLS